MSLSLKFVFSCVAASLLLTASPTHAAIIVVDDFDGDSLSASASGVGTTYQQTDTATSSSATILFATNDATSYGVYSTLATNAETTGPFTTYPNKLTYSFTTTATNTQTQTVLIRDDYKLLTDGDWVQVTSSINSSSIATGSVGGNGDRLYGGLALIEKGDTTNADLYGLYFRRSKALTSQRGSVSTNVATLSSLGLSDPVTYRFTRIDATHLLSEYSTNWDPLTQTGTFATAVASVTVPDFSTLGFGIVAGGATNSNKGTISFDNLTANIAPVPEPATYLMGAIGVLVLGIVRRRTRR
jgi:hypothetical protein